MVERASHTINIVDEKLENQNKLSLWYTPSDILVIRIFLCSINLYIFKFYILFPSQEANNKQ